MMVTGFWSSLYFKCELHFLSVIVNKIKAQEEAKNFQIKKFTQSPSLSRSFAALEVKLLLALHEQTDIILILV